jgi:hypothetical protein
MVNNRPGHETVLRTGGGVFFDTGNQVGSLGYNGVGFSASKLSFGVAAPFPGGVAITPSTLPPYTGTSIFDFYPHLQLPYTLEWSAALEQALGQARSFTITYVGSNGRRLLEENEFSITAQNPSFGNIYLFRNGLTSSYEALQSQFHSTVSHGVQALLSYTWSHSLDFGSTANTLPYIRGNSDFDVRHNLAAALSWSLPNVSHNTIAKVILNDWSIDNRFSARTGFPVTLQGKQLTDPATGGLYYGGVNYDPSRPAYVYGSQYPGGRAINGGSQVTKPAFTLPTGTNVAGNAPRNFVRGFGSVQMNVAARREFHLYERLALQFRAEAFNVFNHPNFGYVDPTLTDATFGQATTMLNQSLATMSPLYQTGGPRSLQFALKLQF